MQITLPNKTEYTENIFAKQENICQEGYICEKSPNYFSNIKETISKIIENLTTTEVLSIDKQINNKFLELDFGAEFDIDATNPLGDATMWIEGETAYIRANTEKGNALVEILNLEESDGKEVSKQQAEVKEIIEKLPFSNLDLSYFKDTELKEIFNRPEWQKLSEACLACGTCTFVCPTCQCFDIRDFKTDKGIIRYRCWDSCMYSDFTQMAHGNNRTTQTQRYRQRFMHKLKYYPEQNGGLYSCVGCGRCVNKCPQRLNIVKVVKTLGEK